MRTQIKILAALVLLLLPCSSWATTTITGTLQDLSGNPAPNGAFVRFYLRGCSGGQPRVNGTVLIAPTQGGVWFKDFAANASDVVSGTIYSTRDSTGLLGGDIDCNGSHTSVWYGMVAFLGGKAGPQIPVHAKSVSTLDVTQVTPITTNPAAIPPTGDATYLRLDAGNVSVTGNLAVKSLDSIQFADQFSGTDASAKIQAAITALPSIGGIVDARNLSDAGGTGSTVIDPGARSVTILLGPYTYQIRQIVLESNFHIIGAGMGQALGSGAQPTILQACSTCGSTNTFVLGTNGGNGGSVQHILLDGFRIYATSGNTTQIGFNLKTVNGSGTGLWYSTFRNLCIGNCNNALPGFNGGTLVFDATPSGSVNQFIDLYNVQAFRGSLGASSGSALSLLGTNGQMTFNQCEFDGPTRNDGGTAVILTSNASPAEGGPYSITFNGSTVQHATLGVSIAGAYSITFINTHFENVGGAMQFNSGPGSFSSLDISVIGSTCQNACGNNGGSGFFAKNLAPASVTSRFTANQIQASVDATYVGFTNISNFTSIGDETSTIKSGAVTSLPNLFGQQITYKTGSSGGDYTTTSTNYVQVDGTNLLASIFIPTGWKLVVTASGAIQSNAGAAQVFVAIADSGTPLVINTSLPSAAGAATNFSLNTVISGNGGTHSIDLRFKTANAADAADIVNNAGNGIPQMVFTLMPSN